MVDVTLDKLASETDEATIQAWFSEEGDAVSAGDDLVQLSTDGGTFIIQAPVAGVLAEVYYDEGESVAQGEVLCRVDENDGDFGSEEE